MVSINVIVFLFLKILHNRFHAKVFAGKSGFEIRRESASSTHAETREEHFNESLFRLAWTLLLNQDSRVNLEKKILFHKKMI